MIDVRLTRFATPELPFRNLANRAAAQALLQNLASPNASSKRWSLATLIDTVERQDLVRSASINQLLAGPTFNSN